MNSQLDMFRKAFGVEVEKPAVVPSQVRMIGKSIELNEVEQRLVKHVAKSRFDNNRGNGVSNSKIGKQSNEETDLEGFGSEVAFAKLFNVFPDMTVSVRSSKEDKGDATLNGMTVDVKTTKYPDGLLLAVIWKQKTVDLYALMTGEFPRYTFRGFMKASVLLSPSHIGELKGVETYRAEQRELREIWDLENS